MIIFSTFRNLLSSHWDKWLTIPLVLIGYFQIAFFIFPLKFGAIAYHFPWRVQIVDILHQGELPLWYFNQHVGVPIFADPQSGAWYPIVWLFSLFGEYSLYSFHIENIIHFLFAAWGMQLLSKEIGISKFSAFLASITYVFSGIFSDNVLTSWTISMAWSPIIFALIIRYTKDLSNRTLLAISLSLFMLISGGYPAFTIVLAYLILGFSIYKGIIFLKTDRKHLKKWIFGNITILVLSALMSFVILVSVGQSFDFISRTQPLSLDFASDGALHLNSFLSFLLPFSVVGSENGIVPELNTYFTMANSYFGILFLVFFFYALIDFKSKSVWILTILALFFILFSMGSDGYVYNFLFNYFPGINLFRYPNFLRAFYIPLLILVSSFGVDQFFKNSSVIPLRNISFGIIIFFSIVLFYSIFSKEIIIETDSIYQFLKTIEFHQRIIIQSFIQLLILLFFVIILIKTTGKRLKYSLMGLVLFDMILSFQMNYIYTGYAPRISLSDAQEIIDTKSRKISIAKNQNILQNYKPRTDYYFDYGLMDYEGKISFFGNLSFKTKGFESLMYDYPKQYERVLSNPVIYFSREIKNVEKMNNRSLNDKSTTLYIDREAYDKYKLILDSNEMKGEILESDFKANSVELKTQNNKASFITLLQNYYPGWKGTVNGKEAEIVISNLSFMSIFVEEGKNKISYIYENKPVKRGFLVSLISFILVLFWFIYLIIFKPVAIENQ